MNVIEDMTIEQLDALQERIRLVDATFLAARIKRARRDSGLSHDKLGEQIGGVTRQHLIKLEKAQHRPRARLLLRIAKETSREIDWFLDPSLDPSPFPNEAAA